MLVGVNLLASTNRSVSSLVCSVHSQCVLCGCVCAAAFGCASVFSGKAAVNISSASSLLSAYRNKEGRTWQTFSRNSKFIFRVTIYVHDTPAHRAFYHLIYYPL